MQRQHGAVGYLDGIRGIAAFLVFTHHFCLAFYPAYFTQKAATSHLNGLDMAYGTSYLSFLTNGSFCVQIFFVLSGFVLSRKYFLTNELEYAISGLHRRFIRLFIPVGFTLILSFVLMTSDLYFNVPASQITMSDWFIKKFHLGEPLVRFIASFTHGTMFLGDASFDTSMWTMSAEFYGSYFVYAFLVFTHFTKYRIFMMFLAMYFFYMIDAPFYLPFVLGMTLCYTEQWIATRRNALTHVKAFLLLALALLLGSIPFASPIADTWQEQFKNMGWDYVLWINTISAYCLVLAFVLSPLLQKIVNIRPLSFLGYISFSLYLLHPVVMASYSSWLFLKINQSLGYNQAVFVVYSSTVVVLGTASWVMARYIDQYGIRLAKRAYEYVKKRPAEPIPEPAKAVVPNQNKTPKTK